MLDWLRITYDGQYNWDNDVKFKLQRSDERFVNKLVTLPKTISSIGKVAPCTILTMIATDICNQSSPVA